MVGVVLITHPFLGIQFIRTAELICGKIPAVVPVSINTDMGMEQLRRSISAAVKSVDSGNTKKMR